VNNRVDTLKALIRLIEDPDLHVFNHVKNELLIIGDEALPALESAWHKNNFGDEFQIRIQSIIEEIHRSALKNELIQWIKSEEKDLLLGSIIVS
jgi:fructose-1,6-bisphosphatase